MLQHIHNSHTYWFCRSCWQEMPVLEGDNKSFSSFSKAKNEKSRFSDLSLAIDFAAKQKRMRMAS
jgi:hypothetical protein